MHENVLRNVSWIDMLALKMSFGYQGNMSAQDSPRLIIKKGGTDNDFKEYSSTIDRYPNLEMGEDFNLQRGCGFLVI